jgi:hypothetical protein
MAAAAFVLGGCRDAGGDTVPEATRAPARAGDVWAVDSTADRATAPAALLAYVNGLHVMVLDDDEAFAGMTQLRADRDADGMRTFHLANGLDAQLVEQGDALQLRFTSGETITMRRRAGEAP